MPGQLQASVHSEAVTQRSRLQAAVPGARQSHPTPTARTGLLVWGEGLEVGYLLPLSTPELSLSGPHLANLATSASLPSGRS